MSTPVPRDLVGYAGNPPHPHWPGEARIAVNWVINYEEGSEYNVHDDGFSESTLTESGGISDVKGPTSPPRACSSTEAGWASGGCCGCSRSAGCR
jgi:hypothetical protein